MIRSHVFCSKGAKFQNPFATTGPFMTILRNSLGGPGMKILPKVFYNFLCADLMGIPMKRCQKSLHDFVQILSVSRSCGGRATSVCRLQPWFLKIVLRSIPALPIHITFWHIWFCFVPKHFFVKTWENFTVLRFGETPWQIERRRKCPYEVIAPWYLLCFSISILSRLLTNSRRSAFQLKFLALVEVNPCSQCEAIYRRMWEFQEQKFPSIFNYGFVSPCVNFHFEIILHFSVRLSTTASLE
jgi:hypothetical protein